MDPGSHGPLRRHRACGGGIRDRARRRSATTCSTTMADTVTPQGIVAVARQFPVTVKELLAGRLRSWWRSSTRCADPGNAGTIIRAADAAGADGVILTGRSVDAYNPKVVRSTTGSLFHVAISQGGELDAAVKAVKGAGMRVLAADIAGDDLPTLRDHASPSRPRGCSATRLHGLTRTSRCDSRMPWCEGSDLRSRRVAESGDRRVRVPVRVGVRAARRSRVSESVSGTLPGGNMNPRAPGGRFRSTGRRGVRRPCIGFSSICTPAASRVDSRGPSPPTGRTNC